MKVGRSPALLIFLIGLVVLQYGYQRFYGESSRDRDSWTEELQQAYASKRSSLQVEGHGVVVKLLADDRKGSRHQRFILRLPTGQTVLVSHNIDLAPRIEAVRIGDTIDFYGVYEYNEAGGVIHWTHHDPDRRHADGWLKHRGITYQ